MVETILLPCQNFCFINPIDEYEFHPIPIDIHLGIIKIPNEEIIENIGINTIESEIVGTDRTEILTRLQTSFAREFEDTENSKNQTLDL